MASADADEDLLNYADTTNTSEKVKSRGQLIERKIEMLENLAGKVSNRRARRWLNDCLLIELVPRLHAEEIRGLFAPPPWGEDTPLSAFCMTKDRYWDAFRTVDMDTEARIIQEMEKQSTKGKDHACTDKDIALNAWRRLDRKTREAMRRNFLPELIESYEERVRAFIDENGDSDVLVIQVQDPFRRLFLHGVCEFYNLLSVTDSLTKDSKVWKLTRIMKRLGIQEVPPKITLAQFLRMAKEGTL